MESKDCDEFLDLAADKLRFLTFMTEKLLADLKGYAAGIYLKTADGSFISESGKQASVLRDCQVMQEILQDIKRMV